MPSRPDVNISDQSVAALGQKLTCGEAPREVGFVPEVELALTQIPVVGSISSHPEADHRRSRHRDPNSRLPRGDNLRNRHRLRDSRHSTA